jgi:hypothetical protein
MNRHAAIAQIESEDVDAVSVFITGDKDSSARNTNIDDLTVFASTDKQVGNGRLNIAVGSERRTIYGLPHLAELSRQVYFDNLPNKIAQYKCEY